jgi:hypothetical protein
VSHLVSAVLEYRPVIPFCDYLAGGTLAQI